SAIAAMRLSVATTSAHDEPFTVRGAEGCALDSALETRRIRPILRLPSRTISMSTSAAGSPSAARRTRGVRRTSELQNASAVVHGFGRTVRRTDFASSGAARAFALVTDTRAIAASAMAHRRSAIGGVGHGPRESDGGIRRDYTAARDSPRCRFGAARETRAK